MATAYWIVAPRRGELRDAELPVPGPDEVRVETLYSAISRGTESLVFNNLVPESQYELMAAPFQQGSFPYPVKYGYISVGKVRVGPPALQGRNVFCLHPHQTGYVVPAESVVPLPEGLPAERAVLGANMETALNAMWDASPCIGDRIAVFGAGTVGFLVAWLASAIPGTEVTLIDPDSSKRAFAERLGLLMKTPEDSPAECDLVVHASGVPAGLAMALASAGYEATVLEMSWFGDREVPLPLGEAFHSRRITLRSSQVGGVSPARRARKDHRRRMEIALGLLRAEALDCLITGESAFHDLPEVMQRLADDGRGVLCHRLRYDRHC